MQNTWIHVCTNTWICGTRGYFSTCAYFLGNVAQIFALPTTVCLLIKLLRGIQGKFLWVKASSKQFKCKCKMCLLETQGTFGFHASPLLSAYPMLIWPRPLSPLLLNTIQTARCTAQGGPQLLTALCGRPHHASQSSVTACLCFRAIFPRSWLHLNHGKRKNKSSMSLSPAPRCPIKSRYAAQMLHSSLGFQEIIIDWEGQHPVAVGEPLPECVWLPMLHMCPCVLAGANMSQTWSVDVRTHRSHRPQEYTAVSW